MGLLIRQERPEDIPAVHKVHEAAFGTGVEARLVDNLRARGKAVVSLVAEWEGHLVGHVLFSPVSVEPACAGCNGVGLGPIAVLPDYQRRGVGRGLVQEGLSACKRAGWSFVVVLGDPGFYRHFGFQRAYARGLRNEYGADYAFMVVELRPEALPAEGSLVRYASEFAELTV
jgi:putative acetyltransferase